MDISKMSDREKSLLLAKAMGLLKRVGMVWYWKDEHADYVIGSPKRLETQVPDLYDPVNMALAWRVHLWAVDHKVIGLNYIRWFDSGIACWLQEDAQRLWLDQILELAVEAGIIEEE